MVDASVLRGLVRCGKKKLSHLNPEMSGRLLRHTLLRQSLKTWRKLQKDFGRRKIRFERRNWQRFHTAWEEEDDFEGCEELHEIQVNNPDLAAAFAALDNVNLHSDCEGDGCDGDDGTVDSFYHSKNDYSYSYSVSRIDTYS